MFLRLLLVWVTFCGFLIGCGSTIDVHDAGPDDGALTPTRFLELEGESSLMLVFGDEARILVRYLDEDRAPIRGGIVTFALEGRAHDSSLLGLDGITQADGVAESTLMAGSTRAAFRVRITAEDADPLWVDVAVGDEGFGQLEVATTYEGTREPRLGVAVFADLTCDDPLTMDTRGDWYRMVESTERPVTFIGLPAGVTFAVVGRGEGPAGDLLAYGCVDGVIITAEELQSAAVDIVDLPQQSRGVYDSQLDFETPETAALLGTQVAMRYSTVADSGARAILDAAEAALTEAGNEDLALLLSMAREDEMEAAFGARLRADGIGPEAALGFVEALVRDRIERVVIAGTLRISDGLVFQVTGVQSGTRAGLMDLTSPGLMELDASVDGALDETGETLVLDELAVTLPVGALVDGVANAELGERAEGGLAELMVLHAECDRVMPPEGTEDYCNEACIQTACEHAVENLAGELLVGLESIGRAYVRMSGEVALVDDTADLSADTLAAELDGEWTDEGDETPESLDVAVAGMRVVTPR